VNDTNTSLSRQEVLEAIYRAVDSVNELRGPDEQLAKSPDLPLLGRGSSLDSLAFTTLVLAAERNIEDLTGVSTELLAAGGADPDALTTVGALTDLVLRRMAE
jgi:hypothetical protein